MEEGEGSGGDSLRPLRRPTDSEAAVAAKMGFNVTWHFGANQDLPLILHIRFVRRRRIVDGA